MKSSISLLCVLLVCTNFLVAQTHNNSELPTSINKNGNAPHPSAMLDIQSDSKGVLMPRMSTTQREAISNPAEGLLVFDTDTDSFWFFSNSIWQSLSDNGSLGTISENQKIETKFTDDKHSNINVDISGDLAVFGAEGINGNPGAAYIFEWDGSRWIEQFELKDNNTVNNVEFGKAVSISNNYIAVGAEYIVYIYVKQGDDWLLQDELTPSNSQEEGFGRSIDIKGDQLIVGSSKEPPMDQEETGAAYIYKRNGTDWLLETKLTNNDFWHLSLFGWEVSISGDLAIVTQTDPTANTDIFLYEKNNDVWSFQTSTYSCRRDLETYAVVSISGNFIIIEDCVYFWDGTNLTFEDKLNIVDSSDLNRDANISGNYAIVEGRDSQVAELFERTSSDWKKVKVLKNRNNDKVGRIGFDNDKILITSSDSKNVYFYQR